MSKKKNYGAIIGIQASKIEALQKERMELITKLGRERVHKDVSVEHEQDLLKSCEREYNIVEKRNTSLRERLSNSYKDNIEILQTYHELRAHLSKFNNQPWYKKAGLVIIGYRV